MHNLFAKPLRSLIISMEPMAVNLCCVFRDQTPSLPCGNLKYSFLYHGLNPVRRLLNLNTGKK